MTNETTISQEEYNFILSVLEDKNLEIKNLQKKKEYFQECYDKVLERYEILWEFLEDKGYDPEYILSEYDLEG